MSHIDSCSYLWCGAPCTTLTPTSTPLPGVTPIIPTAVPTINPGCTVDLKPDSATLVVGHSLEFTATVNVTSGYVTRVAFIENPVGFVSRNPGSDYAAPYMSTITANTIGSTNIRAGVVMNDEAGSTCYDSSPLTIIAGPSPTISPTPVGPTSTISPTPVISSTPTRTPTPSISPTATVTPTPTPIHGNVRARAVEVLASDISCAAIWAGGRGYIDGTRHTITGQPEKTQSGSNYVEWLDIPRIASFFLTVVLPSDYSLVNGCWRRTISAPTSGTGYSATFDSPGETLSFDVGAVAPGAWVQTEGGNVYAATNITSEVPPSDSENV